VVAAVLYDPLKWEIYFQGRAIKTAVKTNDGPRAVEI
jgi:hypothetical protein